MWLLAVTVQYLSICFLMMWAADAFNIDTDNPIVLRSPFSTAGQTGRSAATYFGFSLAFHRSRHDNASW